MCYLYTNAKNHSVHQGSTLIQYIAVFSQTFSKYILCVSLIAFPMPIKNAIPTRKKLVTNESRKLLRFEITVSRENNSIFARNLLRRMTPAENEAGKKKTFETRYKK